MKKVFILIRSDHFLKTTQYCMRLLQKLIGKGQYSLSSSCIMIYEADTLIRFINVNRPSSWRGHCLRKEEWLVTSSGFLADEGRYTIDLRNHLGRADDICTAEFSDFDDMLESVARMVKGRIKWAGYS